MNYWSIRMNLYLMLSPAILYRTPWAQAAIRSASITSLPRNKDGQGGITGSSACCCYCSCTDALRRRSRASIGTDFQPGH